MGSAFRRGVRRTKWTRQTTIKSGEDHADWRLSGELYGEAHHLQLADTSDPSTAAMSSTIASSCVDIDCRPGLEPRPCGFHHFRLNGDLAPTSPWSSRKARLV